MEYITNSGTFVSDENTVMIVDVERKRAVTLDPGLPQNPGYSNPVDRNTEGVTSPTYSFEN